MPTGLSTTAIGGRPFNEALAIYEELKPLLNLDYLELAIGTKAVVSMIPHDLPIVIHNDWVYKGYNRLRANLLQDEGWEKYKELTTTHNIVAFSWHFPKREANLSLDRILKRRVELEVYLGRPFSLEIMPTKEYFGDYNDHVEERLLGVPLCVDLSHLNIWARGKSKLAIEYLKQLRAGAVCYHVSTNYGFQDSHNLIPKGSWVQNWLNEISPAEFVTYEALPQAYSKFDRIRNNQTR
jgi:hypothetical protein